MPKEVIYAMLLIKKACALTNKDLMALDPKSDEFKKFSPDLADKIVDAVDEILKKFEWFYENHFPLVVWQTGSGTQTKAVISEVRGLNPVSNFSTEQMEIKETYKALPSWNKIACR